MDTPEVSDERPIHAVRYNLKEWMEYRGQLDKKGYTAYMAAISGQPELRVQCRECFESSRPRYPWEFVRVTVEMREAKKRYDARMRAEADQHRAEHAAKVKAAASKKDSLKK